MATGEDGVLYDPVESNDLGALTTLIGFVGNASTGAATGPEAQVGAIHRIGVEATEAPGVLGYTPPVEP